MKKERKNERKKEAVGPPALNVDVISARAACLFAQAIVARHCMIIKHPWVATALSTGGGNDFYDVFPVQTQHCHEHTG